MNEWVLSQADIGTIARLVIEGISKRPVRSLERTRVDVEFVNPPAAPLSSAGRRMLAANTSNVRPENAEFQALPKPMVNALLACRARGPLR